MCRTTLKSATKAIGQIILGLLATALLRVSSIGFFYGLALAGSGKDLFGGILLTIVCNTFILYSLSMKLANGIHCHVSRLSQNGNKSYHLPFRSDMDISDQGNSMETGYLDALYNEKVASKSDYIVA